MVHYRVLCVAGAEVENAVREAARKLGVEGLLQPANPSRGGTYQSYQLSVEVDSQARMGEIDAAFRAVPGVKMVL